MLDEYGKKLSAVMVGIYESVQEVEQNMLNNSRLELSISEIHIIDAIGNAGGEDGCTVSEIARALNVTLPTVTVAVSNLVKKGDVEKTRSESDGRRTSIVLTRKGKKAYAVHRYFHEKAVSASRKGLDEEEQAALMKAMENLYSYLLQSSQK